jgi:hypothetical protein
MDLGDFLSALPIDPGGRRSSAPEDSASGVLALLLLPTVYGCLLFPAGLSSSETLVLVLPLVLAVLSYGASRRLGSGVASALGLAIGCVVVCGVVLVCGIFLSFFSTF